jgi:putative serine protease PepD
MDRPEPRDRSTIHDLPDPVWPATSWPAGPIAAPTEPHHGTPLERRSDRWTMVLTLLGGVLLGTGVTLGVLGLLGLLDESEILSTPATTLALAPTTTAPLPLADDVAPTVTAVAATAIPSIVAVEVATGGFVIGGGSGVVYSDDGYVVTNNHVIEGAEEIIVVFSDGVAYPGTLVGTDPLTDIAVISTTRPDLTPITLGSEADLVIGERAVAVGNPLGLLGGPSVTTGILSATGRSLKVDQGNELYGLLQTDAPITRGSSGGALLDQEAKLIGITTAIGVSDVGAEGLGFAVPVDLAVSIADDLIADGSVRHAMLGITGGTISETREDAAIPLGVGVQTLSPGSPYAAAGGEADDVIIQLEGEPVTSIQQLLARLRHSRADDEVTVRVLRGDEELAFDITLGEWADG